MPTLKSQRNGPLLIGTLAVDGWPVTFGIERGGAWAGWGPAQSPPRCTKCYSPPINASVPTSYYLCGTI